MGGGGGGAEWITPPKKMQRVVERQGERGKAQARRAGSRDKANLGQAMIDRGMTSGTAGLTTSAGVSGGSQAGALIDERTGQQVTRIEELVQQTIANLHMPLFEQGNPMVAQLLGGIGQGVGKAAMNSMADRMGFLADPFAVPQAASGISAALGGPFGGAMGGAGVPGGPFGATMSPMQVGGAGLAGDAAGGLGLGGIVGSIGLGIGTMLDASSANPGPLGQFELFYEDIPIMGDISKFFRTEVFEPIFDLFS